MTRKQYNKLIENVTHIEVDNNLYGVSKRVIGDGPVLVAQLDNEGEVTEIEFSEEALMSGEIDKDGEVYIKEMGDSTDCQFRPLTMWNIF